MHGCCARAYVKKLLFNTQLKFAYDVIATFAETSTAPQLPNLPVLPLLLLHCCRDSASRFLYYNVQVTIAQKSPMLANACQCLPMLANACQCSLEHT